MHAFFVATLFNLTSQWIKVSPWATPYQKTLALIDEAHAQDPKKVVVEEQQVPYELHYALTMSH